MPIRAFAFAVLLAGQVVTPALAYGSQTRSDVNPIAAALWDFRERVDDYMDLRDDVTDDVKDAETTRNPADIRAREHALAAGIRARRAHAKHGDIFTPEIRAVFRRLLAPHARGERGEVLRSTLEEDAPAPGSVPLEVNAKYPAGLPFPTSPPTVLAALPRLPAGLEYRILGKDLILLDQPADVILDYIRNAIP